MLKKIKKELNGFANQKKANTLKKFFKTGPGEYGEGDVFLGIKIPKIRTIAKKYYLSLNLKDTVSLLGSKLHEERLLALFVLILKYSGSNKKIKTKIFELYLKNTKYINNWDLVDLSAHRIPGDFLFAKNKKILYKLAKSKSLWERRIAIVSTYYFIKNNMLEPTLKISKLLLKDNEDLIHKAVGWMLREVGKQNQDKEEEFLKKNYSLMPRTMLRYAIEKFKEKKRKTYLKGEM